MTNLTKPTEEELEAIEIVVAENDGHTPYSAAAIVNKWLEDDGLEAVKPQRVYSQFRKALPKDLEDERLRPRLTDEGLRWLCFYVYDYVRTEQGAGPKATSTDDIDSGESEDNDLLSTHDGEEEE